MAAFGCPGCGSEVVMDESSAGRRVRCGECGTLVEIPFLTRPSSRRRARRRSPTLMIVGGGLVAAILMIVAALVVASARGRAYREGKIAEAVRRSENAEAAGQFTEALSECESALKIAKTLDASARKPLKERRNRLAVRETEAQLLNTISMPNSVESLRAIIAQIERDPARESVRDRVFETLSMTLLSRSESDLIQANAALSSGHSEIAIELCERIAKAAEELGKDRAGELRESATKVARQVLDRYGIVFAPVTGEFLQGPSTARLHATALQPIIAAALKRKGFLPKPISSAFLREWDEASPYRLEIEVVERNQGPFFQTPLHTTRLTSHLVLAKDAKYVWEARPQGQTRVPPPDMSAFEMSNLSLAKTRDPAQEKRLYNDARAVLAENVSASLRNLPGP